MINAANGDDVQALNNASALGDWTPKDNRDLGGTGNAVVNMPGPEHTLAPKSLAIQKSVAIVNNVGMPGASVGDTLEYTLQFQVSDFFAFQNVVISDTISDGQHYDSAFQPTLAVNGNGFTLGSAAMNGANITVAPNYTPADPAPNDGTTTFTFRVSDELMSRGQPNGRWIGGCVPLVGTTGPTPSCSTYNDGATTATLTFRTVVLDQFTDTFPSGDPYVDSGDHLDNAVTIAGDLLSVANTNNPTGFSEADTSGASIDIVFGNLNKSVYAVNGSTSFTSPVQISPGDTVTYRIQYDLASSDFENLQFIDNLPLPIFSATQIAPPLNTLGGIPPAGQATYGPSDTYHTLSGITPTVPTITNNPSENSLTFDYGTFNDPSNRQSKIDLLFTVTVNSQPFADKLFLTNQVHEADGSTNGPTHQADAIIQLQLTEPVLTVKKGVIGSDHAGAMLTPPVAGPVAFSPPGSAGARWTGTINSTSLAGTPIDSNISGVDTGDLVSYAIVVENTGTSQKGAFDVTITDTLPSGLVIPTSGAGLNLQVRYGDGTPLTFIGLGGGGAGAADDLFYSGIKLDDPASVGACQKYDPNNGRNIIVITYDLSVDPSAPAGAIIPNRASITNYAGDEGGPNFVPTDHPTNVATTTVAAPGLLKQLSGTEIANANNSSTQAVIGELVSYTLTLTVPEGVTSNAQVVDTLDSGLAFKDIVGVSSSPGVNMSAPIGLGASPANVAVAAGGGTITFSPGTLTNSDTNNAQAETIMIVYRAVVLNVASNQDAPATLLNNSATLTWANGSLGPISAANVTVIEPILSTTKSVVTTPASNPDAGDAVAYTIVIHHTPASQTDAYDVAFSDALPKVGAGGPSYIDNPILTVADSAGIITSANFSLTGSNAAGWTLATTAGGFDFAKTAGRTLTLTLNGTISGAVAPGIAIPNTATTQWTSLDDAPGARSTYNASSTERSGTGGIDDYTSSGSASFTPAAPLLTKSIVATSEVHTGNAGGVEHLAIGEIVRYRLVTQLPEGTSTDFQVHDSLPGGLTFLNDGSARMAFVSNGAGIASSGYGSGAGLIPALACANTAGASGAVTPACTLADANISSSATSDNDTYSSGTDPFFKLGTLVNTDSDADGEFVVIEFNALVDNTAAGSNDAGDSRNNTFGTFVRNTAGTLVQVGATSNNANGRISEPSIPFSGTTNNKTVSPTSGDAGDVVTYTVRYQNANGADNTDAFDVRMLDNLPASITLNVASVNVAFSAPCSAPAFTNNSAANTVDVTVSRVALNCQVTITYQATLKTSVSPGQLITNTANLTYTSLPGTNGTTGNPTGSNNSGAPGSDTGERDGSGGTIDDYFGSDTAQVTVFVPAPVKSLVATSEGHTSGANLAIGEIGRYRMVVRVAEGASPSFQLRDSLPTGLRFLDDGTARVALVSSDPGLTSSTLSGAGLAVVGNETTVSGVTPTFVLPSAAISGGTGAGGAFLDGDDPTFSLGDLANTDSDGDQEFVVVEFNALADNVVGNTAGTALDNTFDVLVNGSLISTSNSVGASVVEPTIDALTKQVVIAPTDAGDAVVYTLTYTNTASGAGRADAFEVALIDTLNANLSLQSVSVTTPAGANAADTSTLGAGGVVRVAVDRLPPSSDIPGAVKAVTVVVTARVINSAPNGQIIPNMASLTYTSLPGSSGTISNPTGSSTPGGSGAANGERDGSGLTNNYSTSSNPVDVTLATPTVAKLAPAAASYTIGNNVTYDIRVTLPEGATPGLEVVDTLPAGMAYVSHSVVTTAAASNGHLTADYSGTLGAPTFTNTSGVLTFDFGTPQTNGSGPANGTGNNQFLVRVVARVQNVIGNQAGTILTNSASLTYTNPNSGATATVPGGSQSITVVEPALSIAKSVSPLSANVGDLVTYRMTITNTSAVAAYDVLISDTVPSGLTYEPGTIAVVSGPAGVTNATGTPNLTWSFASVPAGATAVVEFKARINGSGASATPIGNTAGVTWSSTPGANPDERTGAGAPLNDYSASGSATLSTAAYQISKTLLVPASGPARVNDTVQFGITITNTGAVPLATVPLADSFDPAFLQFITASVAPDSSAAGLLTWNNVGPLNSGAAWRITVDFKALAATTGQPGGVTSNRAGVSGAQDSNGASLTVQSSSATVAIGAPDLHLTKSAGISSIVPGAPITYTLAYINVGSIAATGVVITETVPASTRFMAAGSTPTVWSCADGAVAGTTCITTIPGAVAGNGGAGSVRFVTKIDDTLPSGITQISNTAVIGDDGANGPDATPGNNTGSAVTPISPTAITLVSFSATPEGDGIRVRWETSVELNTWGFYLYRSADGNRNHAIRITPELILGRGRGQGATYTWDDATAEEGVIYRYWLQEVELNGDTNEYGPASAARGTAGAPYSVFVPQIAANQQERSAGISPISVICVLSNHFDVTLYWSC